MSDKKFNENVKSADTYSHTENCKNCGTTNAFEIPKGTTIDSFMWNKKCSNCGCYVRK